ncbi:MAG: hypothetical protein U1C33_08995, partial [Candidatus Cloacimonadaceae bacterium]|nr:hypothetical protein [Candidatus Cloacimonadaceae bacterium]
MRYVILSLLLLVASMGLAITIYDIQYTNTPGVDNTYPSPYVGKAVSIEGIVTAIDFKGGAYFISEPVAGPWRGIMVSDRRNSPSIGDKIQISGVVRETFGMTCIQDISSFRVIDTNLPLPQPITVTTAQLNRADEAEAYEGVFIRVLSTTCAQINAARNRFYVTDGTGQCQVKTSEFGNRSIPLAVKVG